MDARTKARYEARAKIIKAMAHPTRLFIVEQLKKKEKCVCELTEMVGADISTVSKHLSILKAAGIVQDRRKGSEVHYSLKCPCILDFFGCVEQVIKDTAREQMRLIK